MKFIKRLTISFLFVVMIAIGSITSVSAQSISDTERTEHASMIIEELYEDEVKQDMKDSEEYKDSDIDWSDYELNLVIDIAFDVTETYNTYHVKNGYLYEFVINEEVNGYLMMIESNLNCEFTYEITEVYFETKSPYFGEVGEYIYAFIRGYYLFDNNEYFDLYYDKYVSKETIRSLESSGFGLSGHSNGDNYEDSVDYDRKSTITRDITYGLPLFSTSYQTYNNNCGPTSGAIILAYYDRTYTDLIPNYTAYKKTYKTYSYYDPISSRGGYYTITSYTVKTTGLKTTDLVNVMDDLYEIMNTNDWLGLGVRAGTLPVDYSNGLKNYVTDLGYDITYYQANTWANYKTQIQNNRPVIMSMMLPYEYIEKYDTSAVGEDVYKIEYKTVPHYMTGMGYKEIDYFRDETYTVWTPGVWPWQWFQTTTYEEKLFQTSYLVKVADGWGGSGYLYFSDSFQAVGVKIEN